MGMVTAGLAINGVHAMQVGVTPFPTFVAGGFLTGALLFVDEFIDGRLATTLAALYLLASFLFHGQVFITVLSNLAASPPRKV